MKAEYRNPDKPLEVFAWIPENDVDTCADCGNDFDDGDRWVYEPAPEVGPKYSVFAHDYCAVKNGYAIQPRLTF